MKLSGQNILITGANRGIGKAFAKVAAKDKANLILVCRSQDSELIEELKGDGAASVTLLTADLASPSSLQALINSINGQVIDILFNNAGLLTGGLFEEQPLAEIDQMFQVNLTALIHLTHAIVPGMIHRKRGKIINNSSVSAFMHFPCASTYAASKAAVVAFTDCIQAELTGTGVNTLCLITPGIKTRMFDEIEVKYSKNFLTPTESISPEEYALQIRQAVLNDDMYLLPKGTTRMGLWISQYIPSVFRKEIQRRFRRN